MPTNRQGSNAPGNGSRPGKDNTGHELGVLFLCMGNICRSPLAEGAFRAALSQADAGTPAAHLKGLLSAGRLLIDSAGTGGWHAGEPPDTRSIRVARNHGVDISGQRARQLTRDDFDRFDWIVAMDEDNLAQARQRATEGMRSRLVAFVDFVTEPRPPRVPDPYYGDVHNFEEVWSLLARGMGPLVAAISQSAPLGPEAELP